MKTNPFLTRRQPVCPQHLLDLAAKYSPLRTAIVSADHALVLESARQAWQAGILEPVFIGDRREVELAAKDINWDISAFEMHQAQGEKQCARTGAALGREGKVQSIMKGNLHSDIFMRAMISHKVGVRVQARFYHLFYISEPESGHPLILGDAAVNVTPCIETRKTILTHIDHLARATGINRPRIAILSATESVIKTVPSSLEADEISKWAANNLPHCDVYGPLALDLVFSPHAARIKGMENHPVAGKADAVLVPDIVSGNILFKSLVYLRAGCAAGIVLGGSVPILLTSRADPPAARLASCALASIITNVETTE